MPDREDYLAPVGFAREPVDERRRWVARVILAIFVVLIAWLAWNRVINPPDDLPTPTGGESVLPGPI